MRLLDPGLFLFKLETMMRYPITVDASAVVKVANSHNISNNYTIPVKTIEETLSNHYCDFASTISQIDHIKYNNRSNFISCLMTKEQRLSCVNIVFPLINVEQVDQLKIISSATTQRMDVIQFEDKFKENVVNFQKLPTTEQAVHFTALSATAESLKNISIQKHTVWSSLMKNFVPSFSKVDSAFVDVMLNACFKKSGSVVAFCLHLYMFHNMGLQDGLHMVYLLAKDANTIHVLSAIKASIATQTLPYVPSSFTFELFDLAETHQGAIGKRIALKTANVGFQYLFGGLGATSLFIVGKPAASLLLGYVWGKPNILPKIQEVLPDPYVISDPSLKEFVDNVDKGGRQFAYYAVKIVAERAIGAYAAGIESRVISADKIILEGGKILEKSGVELVRVFKTIKDASSKD